MKKFLPFLMVAVLLAGCVLPSSRPPENPSTQPTLSDVEMQTQLAMVLTAMPTQTSAPQTQPTETPGLVIVTATHSPDQPTNTTAPAQPTATSTPEPPQPTATNPPPTATTGPAFTPAPGDPRSHLGRPSSTDGMDDALAWVWPAGPDDFSALIFNDGWMILTGLTDKLAWRLANPEGAAFGDLYLEATFKPTDCSAGDQYGMIVRVPVLADADRGYLFGFTCDGRYSLRKWDGLDGAKGKLTRLKDWTASDAILKGTNQVNRMGLMMVGTRLLMYANGQLLGEVSDGTWTSGYFGLYVGSSATDDFAVMVDEMSYWKNPTP